MPSSKTDVNDGSFYPRRSAGRPPRGAAFAEKGQERDRIVAAALQLIDEKGMAEFNVRDLAARLGVAPATIYWHVPNREVLLADVVAMALSDVWQEAVAGPWQNRLATLLRSFRRALRAHPQLAPLVASQMAYNAAFDVNLVDGMVAILLDAGFTGDGVVDAFNVVVAAMCGFATLELSTAPVQDQEKWIQACASRIDGVTQARHPNLFEYRELLRDRAFMLRWSDGIRQAMDSGFDAWVDTVVRGLEVRSAGG